MNTKKIIATTLITGILWPNFMPLSAHAFAKKNNVLQSQVTEYKFKNVNLDWWKNYNDELLEGYIVKAIDENQDLKIATLKVEEARQQVKLQFSKELPTASIGAAPALFKPQGDDSSTSMFGVPLLVSYEADIFLKNHDKTKSVKKRYEVSKLHEKAVYISVASHVGATYFNIVKLDKLISIQDEIVADRKQIYELMKARNQQGITSTADLVRADKAYVVATAGLSDLKKSRTIMLNSLAVLIGESPNNIEELKRISYDELNYQKAIPVEISSEIITQRPDYMAAEKQVERAGIDVKVAKKEFLPNVNILGLLFFSATSISNSMSWTNALAGIAGSAMLPIFTGGAKFANLRLNKNKYEQVLQNYYKTNLVAIQEVNDSLSSLKFDDEKYNKTLKSYDMQKADFKYTQLRYNQGVISKLDLIQQRESLLTIDKLVAESKTNCYIDQIGLYKAVGGKL
jgi:NodT family efflux transporter outer membrane factor (OMF) lipoprotein